MNELRPLLSLRGVSKAYGSGHSQVLALRDVDLSVMRGEVVALRGASGSGKSTLLNVIGCLDRPSTGQYLLDDIPVGDLDREGQAWIRLHRLGFVFQTFHLIAHQNALENVSMPLYYAGVPRPARRQRALELLARVGLAGRALHRPSELSGGERQRVALARALTLKPMVLLADEPTGALDSRTGREIIELLLELRRTDNLTILLVTHDADIAAFADRSVELKDGRIAVSREERRAPLA
jgi:ABC-type lipoprotein export system ATPase subunit